MTEQRTIVFTGMTGRLDVPSICFVGELGFKNCTRFIGAEKQERAVPFICASRRRACLYVCVYAERTRGDVALRVVETGRDGVSGIFAEAVQRYGNEAH